MSSVQTAVTRMRPPYLNAYSQFSPAIHLDPIADAVDLDIAVVAAAVDALLTADELAAINGAAAPAAGNVFATMADVPADELTADELAAINGAAAPAVGNVFATMADVPADELTADELAAINGAAAPTGANVFATMADVGGGGGVVTGTKTTGSIASGGGTEDGTIASMIDSGIVSRLTVAASASNSLDIKFFADAARLVLLYHATGIDASVTSYDDLVPWSVRDDGAATTMYYTATNSAAVASTFTLSVTAIGA